MLLRELFPEIFKKEIKEGDFCVLNILAFFEKTNFLLASESKNTSKLKFRPIIIFEVDNESVKFFATTTYPLTRKNRPKISLKGCKFFKNKDECFGIDIKRKFSWIFAKKTSKKKRYRVFYTVDIHTLKELKKENLLEICGNCRDVLKDIEKKIYELGEIYEHT
ncbi:MAG: hypothetical protein DSY47_04395 [Hydrogenothermus sp.]|nr:MAG: hypothetical protein DSY47_04395 [Hydrogenothermus sp.]